MIVLFAVSFCSHFLKQGALCDISARDCRCNAVHTKALIYLATRMNKLVGSLPIAPWASRSWDKVRLEGNQYEGSLPGEIMPSPVKVINLWQNRFMAWQCSLLRGSCLKKRDSRGSKELPECGKTESLTIIWRGWMVLFFQREDPFRNDPVILS